MSETSCTQGLGEFHPGHRTWSGPLGTHCVQRAQVEVGQMTTLGIFRHTWWQCLLVVLECPRELAAYHILSTNNPHRQLERKLGALPWKAYSITSCQTHWTVTSSWIGHSSARFMSAPVPQAPHGVYCSFTFCWSQASKDGTWFVLRIQPYQNDLSPPSSYSRAAAF